MKRPLSLVLAAAFAASTMAMSVAPAAADNFGVTIGTGGWDNDGWHDNGTRYRHHRQRHRDNVAPGFSFSIGTPYPESRAYYRPRHRDRDCYRNDWDEVVCRY